LFTKPLLISSALSFNLKWGTQGEFAAHIGPVSPKMGSAVMALPIFDPVGILQWAKE
jgi:hypothetical protein